MDPNNLGSPSKWGALHDAAKAAAQSESYELVKGMVLGAVLSVARTAKSLDAGWTRAIVGKLLADLAIGAVLAVLASAWLAGKFPDLGDIGAGALLVAVGSPLSDIIERALLKRAAKTLDVDQDDKGGQ